MKSNIRVLFESLISCGKPSKGNDKDQGPVVIDEPETIAQGQKHQDEPKHAQLGQDQMVKHEPENAQGQMVKHETENGQGQMVIDEPKKAKEQVQETFVYRAHIKTYRRIAITSRQSRPPRKRPPPPPQTGKAPNK
ncbi:uncharacterized protein LOC132060130 isoform X2 [Lycium ferocissimum]|uniref:uncharacterized protein LOC132060130 isoform X2 n=1 Tax=Lycium ferocissimum TaxID=112874 RepID=UPI002816063F|nr:uncharacterized protein LOC132060130 isoform X2 [Lycium ferocissimum]